MNCDCWLATTSQLINFTYYFGREKTLSPPRFQHCGRQRPRWTPVFRRRSLTDYDSQVTDYNIALRAPLAKVPERIEYNTSLVWWCTGVCMTGRLGTSLITSSQPLMLVVAVFVYDPLTWIVSLFLAADSARTSVGFFFITLARRSGTRCQMNLEIPIVLMTLNTIFENNSFQTLIVWPAH